MKNVRLLTKESYHEEEGEGTWAVSYGDMITLLLSFFVIFFTTDVTKEKMHSLNHYLAFELESARDSEVGGKQKVELENLPKIEGAFLTAHQVDENIVVTFKMTSFFDSGEVKLNDHGKSLILKFAEKYMPYVGNYRLAVKGFTDVRPVTKRPGRKYEDNLELSALRSISAMKILRSAGIPLNRMEIAGGGELEAMDKILPRKEGLTPEELHAYSRTVVLVISPIKESWL